MRGGSWEREYLKKHMVHILEPGCENRMVANMIPSGF